MLKKVLVIAGLAGAFGIAVAPAASAAASVCYSVSVTINGETTAAADCVEA